MVLSIFLALTFAGATGAIPPADSTLQVQGQEIVVTKHLEKKISGLSVGKITVQPEAISSLPSFLGTSDLLKALELTPGIQTSSEGNSGLHIRGGDAGHNLLLYAGAPLYTPGHLLGFLPLFNPDHIAAMELEKSTVPARFGGRLNAALQVDAPKKLPQKTSLKGTVGILASQLRLDLPTGKNFGIYLSGRKTYLDLLVNPLLNKALSDLANDNISGLNYNFQDLNATLIGNLSEKDRLTIDFLGGKDDLDIADPRLLLNGRLNWHNSLISAQWERTNAESQFSQQVYFSNYHNRILSYQADMSLNMQSRIEETGYKNAFRFHVQQLPVETGLQYAFHRLQPQTFEMNNSQLPHSQYRPARETAHHTGLYAETQWPLSNRLKMNAGLRTNFFFHERGFWDVEPRLALQYFPTETSVIRLSYNRQHQYLHLLSPTSMGLPLDFYVSASQNLPPQSGNLFSAGYFKSFQNSDWEFSADVFFRTMNHVIEYVQTITSGQTQSYLDQAFAGKGRAYGLELMLKKNDGRWNGWLSYTLGRSERQFAELNQGKPFPARFDRLHDLSFTSVYSFNERWEMSLVYIYATGNAYTLPSSWYFINSTPVKEYGAYNGARMPAYNRTDLSVQYWYKKDNGFIFSVYNLFMVNNPMYVFLNVERDDDSGKMQIEVQHKKLFSIMPSISWRFKF
ncbi:MAG: TonB-dependent receptor [Dysgonamonadaceae bacterium]|jgi:outer membrane receptor for ferrienterochelin and colicin|nr:TonB-dependent receptor [Dysgonamonadaceae bacterium]